MCIKLRKFKQIYIPLFPYYYSFPFIQIFLSISLFPYSFILSLLSLTFFFPLILSLTLFRGSHTDFGMGGDQSPPIGGGPKGGDKGPMGGDWRVIRNKNKGPKKISLNP